MYKTHDVSTAQLAALHRLAQTGPYTCIKKQTREALLAMGLVEWITPMTLTLTPAGWVVLAMAERAGRLP